MTDASDSAALAGVVVIENGKGVAASYAGRILALMGATVIKVECPGEGDALRHEAPQLNEDFGTSAIFAYLNVNKSSVTLDLSTTLGRQLLGELLDRASVFIDDTHPSERSDAGIEPEDICGQRPDLIYVSVLPFGTAGAHSEYRAYELNVFHSGGEGYLMPNGLALETFPDRPPVKIYGHFAELNGGTSAVCATLAALLVQSEAGGQLVDVSVQDANVALSCFALQQLGEGVLENRHARSFKYGGVLECSDGYVQVLTLEQHQWEGLVKLMGEPAWAQEPALKDPLERSRRGSEINKHIRAWAKSQKVEDLVNRGQAVSVPLAKYAEPSDIFESAQTKERAMFAMLDREADGQVPVLVAPFQSGVSGKLKSAAKVPGADNSRIWCDWLGHSASELERWASTGAV
jgi:crotonobetainyl-CoA:carnitine CoA-transferase CaiB-like acyl-CoA transferase